MLGTYIISAFIVKATFCHKIRGVYKMKKVLKIIGNVFTALVVLFTVGVMIFTIVSVNTVNKSDSKFFGYSAYIVLSDSMKDTFNSGDIVFSKKVDAENLKEGDVISFKSIDPSNYGEVVTHKIRSVTSYEGKKAFITYGTTTNSDDSFPALAEKVVGQYQFKLPKMGTFFQFLKTIPGYITIILVPFLVLLILQAIKFFRLLKKYRSEQQLEIDQQKAEVEVEKQKAMDMMKELELLKEKLTADQIANNNLAHSSNLPQIEQNPAVQKTVEKQSASVVESAAKQEEKPSEKEETATVTGHSIDE